jgi:hypothetical protein
VISSVVAARLVLQKWLHADAEHPIDLKSLGNASSHRFKAGRIDANDTLSVERGEVSSHGCNTIGRAGIPSRRSPKTDRRIKQVLNGWQIRTN